MELKSCRACLGWTESPEKIQKILNNEFGACESCADQAVIRAVARQYQRGQPRWWVVNNVVVVPIWLVEMLQRKRDL